MVHMFTSQQKHDLKYINSLSEGIMLLVTADIAGIGRFLLMYVDMRQVERLRQVYSDW